MDKMNSINKSKSLITRRDALKKTGYAAFASSTLFLLLNNPTKVYAASPAPPPEPGPFPSSTTSSSKDKWNDDSDPWK
jgi:hypothetical protein